MRTPTKRRISILSIALFAMASMWFGWALSQDSRVTAQENRIEYGQTIEATLAAARTASWTFDGSAADLVTIRLVRVTDRVEPTISLRDARGTLIAQARWGDLESSQVAFSVRLPSSGVHAIEVENSGSVEMAYALTLDLAAQESGALSISYGQTREGRLSESRFFETWTFSATQGDVVDILMQPNGGNLDAQLALHSEAGLLIADSDGVDLGHDAALYSVRIPTSGTYVITARRAGAYLGADGSSEGTYLLSLAPRVLADSERAAVPVQLLPGADMRGRLTTDASVAVYELIASGAVSIGLETFQSERMVSVEVATSDGVPIRTWSGWRSARATVQLPEAQTIVISVSSRDLQREQQLDYVISADLLGSPSSVPLLYGIPREVKATTDHVPNLWHFAGSAGDLVEFTVRPYTFSSTARVRILAPDGQALVDRPLYDALRQPLALAASGLHEIVLDSADTTGGYQIEIARIGAAFQSFDSLPLPATEPWPTDAQDAVSAELEPHAIVGWHFDVDRAGTYRFNLSQSLVSDTVGIGLLAPDEQWLSIAVVNPLSGKATAQADLPALGRYRVVAFNLSPEESAVVSISGGAIAGGLLPLDVRQKGVLSADATSNEWVIPVPPDSLLKLELDLLSGTTYPVLSVLGPDGVLRESVSLGDSGFRRLVSIASADGGHYRIVAHVEGLSRSEAYHIRAGIEVPSPDMVDVGISAIDRAFIESPNWATTSTPTPLRASVSRQVTPPISFDADFAESAIPAQVDTVLRGEISSELAHQVWALVPSTVGSTVVCTVTTFDSEAGIDITVVNQNGAVLAERFERERDTSRLTFRIDTLQTHYVAVRLRHGGRYTLFLDSQVNLDSTVPSLSSNPLVVYGQTVFGQVELNEDAAETYSIIGGAGDVISVTLRDVDSGWTPDVVLDGPDGEPVTPLSPPPSNLVVIRQTFQLVETGLHTIRVIPGRVVGEPGRFALRVNLEKFGESAASRPRVLAGNATAELSIPDASHRWFFDARGGETVSLAVTSPGNELPSPLTLQIADTAGNVFVEQSSSVGLTVVTLDGVMLPRQGIYQAIVSGGQRQGGLYQIALVRERNLVQETERVVSYGQSVQKTLTRENYLDVWTFAGEAGDTVDIFLRPTLGDPSVVALQVRSAQGEVLATASQADANLSARIEGFELPNSGFYSVAVGSVDPGFEGEMVYELAVTLRKTRALSMGAAVSYQDRCEGYLAASDPVDVWLFEGNQGDLVTVEVSAPATAVAVSLQATDWHTISDTGQPNNLGYAQTDSEGLASVSALLPHTGPFAVLIEDIGGNGGRYSLQISGGPSGSLPARQYLPESENTSAISPSHPANAWSFAATTGDSVHILVTPDRRAFFTPVVRLIDPDGHTVASGRTRDVRGHAEILDYVLPTTGEYQAVVFAAKSGNDSGAYLLDITVSASAQSAPQSVREDSTVFGALSQANPRERWAFAGSPGDVMRVAAVATSGDVDLVLHVLDADGRTVAEADDGLTTNPALDLVVRTDQAYTIVVARHDGARGESFGNYRLSIETVYRSGPIPDGLPFHYGERVAGTTDASQRSQFWVFMGKKGDVIRASLQLPLDDSPLLLTLRDPDGDELTSGTRNGGQVLINWFSLPADGAYSLEVRRPGDALSSFSPYSLELQLLQSTDVTQTNGGVLVPNVTVTGQFTRLPASHLWLFRGSAIEPTTISIGEYAGTLELQISIFGPDGVMYFAEEISGARRSAYQTKPISFPADGLYSVVITGGSDSLGDTYRLTLRTSLESTSNRLLSSLNDGYGTLSDFQPDTIWEFEGTEGEIISLRAVVLDGDVDPVVELWSPQRQLLARGVNDNTQPSPQAAIESVVLPADGRYYVVMMREAGALGQGQGNYRLMLRDTPITALAAQAQEIAYGRQYRDVITSDSERSYTLWGLRGESVAVWLKQVDGGTLPGMHIETEAGRVIASADTFNGTEAVIDDLIFPETGRLVLVLSSGPTAYYDMSAVSRPSAVPDGVQMGSLVPDLGRAGIVDSPGEFDYWAFDAAAGDVFTFTIDTSRSALRADLSLYGPRGLLVSTSQLPGVSGVSVGPTRLPDSGRYVVAVGAWQGAIGGSTGQYTITRSSAGEGVSGSNGGSIAAFNLEVTGGLIREDNTDTWHFSGDAGQIITIRMQQPAGSELASLRLLGADGALLAAGQASTSLRGKDITDFTLPSDGVFTIVVSAELAEEAAIEYRLAIVEQPWSNSLASTQIQGGISYGATLTARMSEPTLQAWPFYAQAGDRVTVAVSPITPSLAISVQILDPGGGLIREAHSGVAGRPVTIADMALPEAGLYSIVVLPTGATDLPAEYEVALDRVSPGALPQGQLDPEASAVFTPATPVHEWTFVPVFSGTYLFEATSPAPVSAPDIFVLSSGDQLLVSSMESSPATVQRAIAYLEEGQVYTIAVSNGPAPRSGSYSIRVMPANSQRIPLSLQKDRPDIGRINEDTVAGVWLYEGSSGETLTVELQRVSGTLLVSVAVYGPDNSLLTEMSGEDASLELPVDLSEDGTYSIIVSGATGPGGSDIGEYAIVAR